MSKYAPALPPFPDDVGEAQKLRADDLATMRELNVQSGYIARLGVAIQELRQHDNFGDDLELSFSRKRKNKNA